MNRRTLTTMKYHKMNNQLRYGILIWWSISYVERHYNKNIQQCTCFYLQRKKKSLVSNISKLKKIGKNLFHKLVRSKRETYEVKKKVPYINHTGPYLIFNNDELKFEDSQHTTTQEKTNLTCDNNIINFFSFTCILVENIHKISNRK